MRGSVCVWVPLHQQFVMPDVSPLPTESRRELLYLAAIRGGTPSALVLEHAATHAITEDDALADWDHVVGRLRLDASLPNDLELARIRASRWAVVDQGFRRGQLAAAGNVLRDLGAAAGEQQLVSTVLAQATPALHVFVEAAPSATPEMEPVAIEAATIEE